jgi:hypothetical protein
MSQHIIKWEQMRDMILIRLTLNSDGQQIYQYQQNNKLLLNSDGQQIYQYQQNKQLPLNSDGQQIYQ